MRKIIHEMMGFLLIFVVLVTSIPNYSSYVASAATSTNSKQTESIEYIKVKDFIKQLVKMLKLDIPVGKMPYVLAAYDVGILLDGDVSSFDANITRQEAALLLNRADEYLHGDTLQESYVKLILDKRISDIKKVGKKYREAVAKVYGKGIIKGYTNGYGVQSRQFRGKEYLTKTNASTYISKVKSPNKRAKLSPDAQLIRTTNLPKNADKFEYILECFPNKFYEKRFMYQYIISSTAPIVQGEDYEFPVNMRKQRLLNSHTSYDMGEQMDLYLYDWADYVERFVNLTFNVSYKTIGDKWVNDVKDVIAPTSTTDYYIERYVRRMKENHVTVKTRKIAVEPSTLYYSDWKFIRVYIEYMVTADKASDDIRDYFFCQGGNIRKLKLGEWKTSYLDVQISNSKPQYGDGSTIKAAETWYEAD